MLTRRQLLERGVICGAGLTVGRASFAASAPAAVAAVGTTPKLRKWREQLPIPPVLDGRGGGKSFTIAARESSGWKFHRDLPATRTWGYWSDNPQAGLPYLGPTIVATQPARTTPSDTSVTIEWRNELDDAFLPNDPTIIGRGHAGRAGAGSSPHLHGGENHPQFDGTPLQWFTKGRREGPALHHEHVHVLQRAAREHGLVPRPRARQHAHERLRRARRALPHPRRPGHGRGRQSARAARRPVRDPARAPGQDVQRRRKHVLPDGGRDAYHPQWVPEFFGDVAVVNAKIWPFVDVEPRRYRFRIVNGSQSRFYNLQFANENSGRALPFTQIGADGGLLRAPVPMTALLIAPGERADVIVDFAGHRERLVHRHEQRQSALPDGRARGLSQLLKIRVNQGTAGRRRHDPGRRPRAAGAPSAARAVGHARAAPVRDARPAHGRSDQPQRRGRALPRRPDRATRRHDEAGGRRRRGLAAREHDRRHASDPPAPRDLRGHRPKALRRRRLRSRDARRSRTPGPPFPRSRTRTGARTRCRPIRAR